MPRGDAQIEGTPYGIWIDTVEKQHRLRVSKDIQDVVPWLGKKPTTIECMGVPGPAGGLQLQPFATDENLRNRFIRALGNTAAASTESAEQWIDAARLLASSWRVTVTVESSRVNIPLPEPIRRALRLPGARGTAVVFAFGEIIEVWDAAEWLGHVRGLAKIKDSVLTEAIEALARR